MIGTGRTLATLTFAALLAIAGCGESHGDEPPVDLGGAVDLGGPADLGGPVDSGAAADLGTDPDLGSGECTCVSETLSWGWEGGLRAFQDSYAWAECATVVKTREDFSTGGGLTTLCELDLGSLDCGAVNAIAAALAAPGLDAARAEAPVIYGVDSRPMDGAVFRIDLGGDVIDVGGECGDRDGCTPIPEAVAALRDALMDAQATVDGADECAGS